MAVRWELKGVKRQVGEIMWERYGAGTEAGAGMETETESRRCRTAEDYKIRDDGDGINARVRSSCHSLGVNGTAWTECNQRSKQASGTVFLH